jgi:hypothetical protein
LPVWTSDLAPGPRNFAGYPHPRFAIRGDADPQGATPLTPETPMFFNIPKESASKAKVTTLQAFRHLFVFQAKLLADAFRDLVMSPLSILVFFVDAIRKPRLEDSLYLRLMLLGRKSDRMINLFDEHKDAGHFTVDEAIEELEELVDNLRKKPD